VNKRPYSLLISVLAGALLTAGAVAAQQATKPAAPASSTKPAAAAPTSAAPAAGQPAADAKKFSQQDLDRLLAPIALYPDNLLAQILMASTYPLEVVQAARWVAANPKVTGKPLEDAMQKQTWDPSVKGLTAVPQVLKQMDENIEWMKQLGDAFLEQQAAVMDTVQALRAKAQANGNLKSTPEMNVKTEKVEEKTVVVIESTKQETVYVPTYNPSVVYGAWAYPAYPPYYMYPPGYVYAPGLTFAFGVAVGAAIWGGCGWGSSNVYINHNNYNNFNRTDINNDIGNGDRGDRGDRGNGDRGNGDRGNGNRGGDRGNGNRGNSNWNHNPSHRGGVPYRDNATADKFNRGGDNRAQSRESFRGREQGGGLSGSDRPSAGTRDTGSRNSGSPSAGTRDTGSRGGNSPSAGTRDTGSRGGSSPSAGSRDSGSRGGGGGSSSRGGGGFGGMSSGSGSRAASSRGSSSFGGRSGGGGGGRGGGGRRR
jgi:Protein of unknown function (DUF3300)